MLASLARRDFLKSTLAVSAAAALPIQFSLADEAKKPKLRMAVKYGMIKHDGSVEDKFNLIKKLGLQGVEVDSPSGLN
ncbi:MAG: twin-arginine translocation signal domain-containing protein, partial [Planctomycetaceae bacterium]|nr:twin-arginine translocation signal domain-containing protein [Planctomycetaceae bacterium]